jgi:hypothetical protein
MKMCEFARIQNATRHFGINREMEQQLSEWDIHAIHKGEWCIYKRILCQEDGGCINCGIYQQAEEKFMVVVRAFKSEG